MNFDSNYLGPQGIDEADALYQGSRFSEVRQALYANRYYLTWGSPNDPPLPKYGVTLGRGLRGLVRELRRRWPFQQAARRAVGAASDLRWGGAGKKGFRRLIHPNAVNLLGRWKIDDLDTGYTGYFQRGSEGLLVARYSTCCSETRRGHTRSLALVGKLYPTLEVDHREPLRTASFITQEDLGGAKTNYINDAELRNAPDTTPWRRGFGLPFFLLTGLVLIRADKKPSVRQLYEIAELGKPAEVPTKAPEFMRLLADASQPRMEGADLDFRDELLGQIYDKGNPVPKRELVFNIEVSDEGQTTGLLAQRVLIKNWKRIGRLVFTEAVASYNGDFVIHFHHPVWRDDRNDPGSVARPRR